MEIKDLIYNRRIELGLTMKQLADLVGVSEGTISRWESGDIANMRRDKIVALARVLEITPNAIMGWTEEEQDQDGHDLTPQELEFAELFLKLSEEKKALIIQIMKSYL